MTTIEKKTIDIQSYIDRHEAFKAKGFKLTEQDLFDWVRLLEEMLDKKTYLKSDWSEEKDGLKVKQGKRRIELKAELVDGKKKHTEGTADAVIDEEFADDNKLIGAKKLQYELLENICGVVMEYINIVKPSVRR